MPRGTPGIRTHWFRSAPHVWVAVGNSSLAAEKFCTLVLWLSRITVNPAICHGQPTVRGLRYPVQNVLELLASGMTDAEILADYEDLEADDLRACQAMAPIRL